MRMDVVNYQLVRVGVQGGAVAIRHLLPLRVLVEILLKTLLLLEQPRWIRIKRLHCPNLSCRTIPL